MPATRRISTDLGSSQWVLRTLKVVLTAACALTLALVATPGSAQDVPWGHAKKKPAKKQPATKKKPVAKWPAKKAPATKKAAADKPAAKKPAKKETAAKKQKPGAKDSKAKKTPKDLPVVPAEPEELLKHFHDALEPHGSWAEDPTYGDVWIPDPKIVGKDFAPYRTGGRWAMTEAGDWAWVSDHKWGSIPFHYGRWVWTKDNKWAWIAGTDYAPAWVVWRVADNRRKFVGWAPMAPTHYWMDGATRRLTKGVLPFFFVPTRYLFSPHLEKFVISDRKLAAQMHGTSHIFGGHASVEGVRGSAPLKAASPKLSEVNVPAFAVPRTRLSLKNNAIAPITSILPVAPEVEPKAGEESSEEGRFATPPPDEREQAKKLRKDKRRRVRKTRRARRWGARHARPRYRCWWTNTRPRIWRCGY